MDKQERYLELINQRKKCRLCEGLENPSTVKDGEFDPDDRIGQWSLWQGNINSNLMVIGQDWGDVGNYIKAKGIDSPKNPTNKNLMTLLDSVGIKIKEPSDKGEMGDIFFTNAILCLKEGSGKLQEDSEKKSRVKTEWIKNCGNKFLKNTIELISPKVVITLGKKPLISVLELYNIKDKKYRSSLKNVIKNSQFGIKLSDDIILFPMYHCGARTINIDRNMQEQLEDWQRCRNYL